jgi:hypothetical protein
MTRLPPPRSAGELAKRVRQYARHAEVAEGRLRLWIGHMALLGAIGAAREQYGDALVTGKGGVAVELRLGGKARATRDLDLTVHGAVDELGDALAHALAVGFGQFSFRHTAEPYRMPNGAVRLRIGVQYAGQAWTSIQVDVTRSELEGMGMELTAGLSLDAFGLKGPTSVPCLPLPYQMAQKLHALVSRSSAEEATDSLRHAVDLLLLQPLVADWQAVRRACQQVFEARGTVDWPPASSLLNVTEPALMRFVTEVGLPVRDPSDVQRLLDELLERIVNR